jgi:hypothetical protein
MPSSFRSTRTNTLSGRETGVAGTPETHGSENGISYVVVSGKAKQRGIVDAIGSVRELTARFTSET